MQEFQSLSAQRIYSESLSLVIFTNVTEEEFQHQLKIADCINEQKKLLLQSDISMEDYLEAVEFFGIDIDKYVAEVETNLVTNLNVLYG